MRLEYYLLFFEFNDTVISYYLQIRRRKSDIDIVASIIKAVGIKSITISSDGSAVETNSQLNYNKNNFYIEG